MDKETKMFYLMKIYNKIQNKIKKSNDYLLDNEIFEYLGICIDICDLLNRKYLKDVAETKEMFLIIKSMLKNKDYCNAKLYIGAKINELDALGKHI